MKYKTLKFVRKHRTKFTYAYLLWMLILFIMTVTTTLSFPFMGLLGGVFMFAAHLATFYPEYNTGL